MALKNKPIIVSPQAKQDLEIILEYLKDNWPQKVTDNFLKKLRSFYSIVTSNPHLFGFHNKSKNIRKYHVSEQNIIFYRKKRKVIEIITIYDGRQDPRKLKKLLK